MLCSGLVLYTLARGADPPWRRAGNISIHSGLPSRHWKLSIIGGRANLSRNRGNEESEVTGMPSRLHKLYRRLRYGQPIIVVSGLPRSGTSMAMKMLEAGGVPLLMDGIRTADEDSPKGYFEFERVKDLASEQE
jgi:hypothetical protein